MKRLMVLIAALVVATTVLFWPSLTVAGEGDDEENADADTSTGTSAESASTSTSKSQYDVDSSRSTHKEAFSTEKEDEVYILRDPPLVDFPTVPTVIIDTPPGSSGESTPTGTSKSGYEVHDAGTLKEHDSGGTPYIDVPAEKVDTSTSTDEANNPTEEEN